MGAYSEASKSNPQVILATPMKPVATKAMKFDDVNIWYPMINCAEKNIDKIPESVSMTTKNLRIEASTSKTWKRSLRVVSTIKLSTSIIVGSLSRKPFLRLRLIQNKLDASDLIKVYQLRVSSPL